VQIENEFRLALAQEKIEARPVWKPLHLQPVFADCECIEGAVAQELFEYGLCLPSGSNLTDQDLERVTSAIAQIHKEKSMI
jgi:dTDP-4-amino-4,6-dideoxygalactose transaminase